MTDEELVEALLDSSYVYEGTCLQRDKNIYLKHKAELLSRLARGRKAIELCKKMLPILTDIDEYQHHKDRGNPDAECACCMGELFDKDEYLLIEQAKEIIREWRAS